MKIIALPIFTDNYVWLIIDDQSKTCIVVDPGDATAVESYLSKEGLTLSTILITHHHHDHIGGLKYLLDKYKPQVYAAPHHDLPKGINTVYDGMEFEIKHFSYSWKVITTPGHTMDHVCYYIDGHLFSGDTLFAAGCGRLFEGTPEHMYNSLQRLKHLPPNTKVYCTHEYTLDNLKFAATVDPENEELLSRIAEVEKTRAQGKTTLPSTILLENQTNPFLRCDKVEFREGLFKLTGNKYLSPLVAFTFIRELKDKWR